MTDGTHLFSFIGRNSYAVTDVDTYWFGDYDIRTSHLWDQTYTYQYGTGGRQGDSGMTYSWQNRTIAPNETQVYSALIGIGDLNTPPVLTNTSTLKSEYYPNNVISLSGTINDVDLGDILKIKYALDGGAETVVSRTYTSTRIPQVYEINFPLPSDITGGKHFIQIWAVDDKGNMSVPISVEFNLVVDTTPPSATHTINPSTWTNASVTITVKATDTQTGVKQITLPNNKTQRTDTVTYTVTENGTYNFILEDNAGNKATYPVTITNIDKIKPTLETQINPTGWTGSSTNIIWNAIDRESGIETVTLPNKTKVTQTNGTYTVTENGTYTFTVRDKAGNQNTYKVTVENIDKIKPELTTQTKPDHWVIDVATIEWTAKDYQSGLKDVQLPNGTKQAQESGTYTVTENGTYTFIAEDNVGNTTTVHHKVTNIDKTPPVLNITAIPVEWNDSMVELHWEASDSQSGFAKIDMPNGGTKREAEGSIIVEQVGIYTFIAYDNVGNQMEVSIDVANIDKINPKLELTVDTEEWTNEDVILTWEADDFESGLREVINSKGESNPQKTGTQSIGENGVYTYIAYDNVGNKTVKEKNIQNIDKIAPKLEIKTSSLENNSGNIEVTWNTKDFESGLREIVLPDGSSIAQEEGTYLIQENGTYTFIAYDNAGNFTLEVLEIRNIYKNMLQLEVTPIIQNGETILHWKVTNTEYYKAIVLPDGTRSSEEEGDFKVEQNGTYTFIAYDEMYNCIAQAVEIKNL